MEFLKASITTTLNLSYFGNTIQEYSIAVLIFLLAIGALLILKNHVISHLKQLSEKTDNTFDDLIIEVIQSYGWPLYVFVGVYAAIQAIALPEMLSDAVRIAVLLIVVFYLARTLQKIVEFAFYQVVQRRMKEEEGFDPSILEFFERVIDVIIWIVAVLLVLQNVGFNVGAVIGGLGIGGVALAFALQSVLGDIFASLSIFFDRPFRTGDFIEVGNDMGTVKEIGIRSTRIQSLRGEMLIIANKELIDSRILNYREVEFRRISFEFSVPYETPNEILKEIPDFVNTIVENEEYAQVERTTFASFEDWGLKFITVYYIKSDDYGEYMYAQERINLSIKAELEQRGTKFAYPTYRAYNYTDEPAIASSETQKE